MIPRAGPGSYDCEAEVQAETLSTARVTISLALLGDARLEHFNSLGAAYVLPLFAGIREPHGAHLVG